MKASTPSTIRHYAGGGINAGEFISTDRRRATKAKRHHSAACLLAAAEDTERYVVAGAGALLVTLEKGDTLTITNDEGGQLCEIIAADEKGRIDPGMLGGTATGDGGGLKALLMSGDASLTGLRLGI